jgi:DNA-binding MarR family transcriptional regulator
MTDPLIGTLERVVVGSVAITARAIGTADAELTFMQWRVLLLIGESEDGVAPTAGTALDATPATGAAAATAATPHGAGATVGSIAARIGTQPSPASRVISRLKRRGLVHTSKDAVDARLVRVGLTEAGREIRRRVLESRGDNLAAILASASLSPVEAGTLTKLAQAFEQYA